MTQNLNIEAIRYIVFLIDLKHKDHDGKIFSSINEAREFANLYIEDGYADKAVIGMFLIDAQISETTITQVETIGFKGDKKNINQLQLFA